MRYLVTGGLGFIGSTFIRMLLRQREDVEIINLDAETYAGSHTNLKDIARDKRYRFIKGDICDVSAVRGALTGGVEGVVNFAAETHVDRSILDPSAFLRTDVMGTHVLLEAVREQSVKRYLQVSTDEVYGDISDGESLESDLLRPRSPYSASKAGGDLQILAYWSTFQTPVLITRGSNTYGPNQYPEKLIPLFISNLIDDQPVPMYGDGSQIRDWLHAEDHASGILHVLEHGEFGNVYNIGGGNPRTNLQITERLLESCGRSALTHIKHVADRAGHDKRYAVHTGKIRELGWAPRIPFEEGLQDTIEWYKDNEDWWRPLKSAQFLEYYRRQYANR